jgi:hypothetical protein
MSASCGASTTSHDESSYDGFAAGGTVGDGNGDGVGTVFAPESQFESFEEQSVGLPTQQSDA